MSAKALPSTMRLGEYAAQLHVHECQKGVSLEDLSDPTYWSLVAPRCRIWDLIQVQRVDGTLWAEFLVIDGDQHRLVVHPLRHADISRKVEPTTVPAGYRLEHQGPKMKWAVIREKDTTRVQSGFISEPEALAWLLNHLRQADRRVAA